MKVSIVSINYVPERTGIGVYTTGMAEFFAARGHEVTVHCGFAYYPEWRKRLEDRGAFRRRESLNGVRLERTWLYVPPRPSALRRILHELSFVATAALGYMFAPRADCTIIVLPPLALGATIALLARIKRSRTILHVQDLQPDAAVELGMLRPGLLTRALYALEGLNYRIVDQVSTISEGMRRKILSKGVTADRTLLFRNWANDDVVTPADRMTALRAEWGLDAEHFVVLYSGNLGRKQGLESLLEAAAVMAREPRIRVVIVGDGAEQLELEARARQMQLDNVMFKPLQPLERLSELLATADVSVIPQKRAITDIVLPSKLCNILASGRAVVAASPSSSDLAMILDEAACGVRVEPEDGASMAEAILRMLADPAARSLAAANARHYAEHHLLASAVIGRFEETLRLLVARS